jgi:tetratricopeptide (TPR) repeat protein
MIPPIALCVALSLLACGARPLPFEVPRAGAPAERAAVCKARILQRPDDAPAHACYREAMARLGQLEVAQATLEALPDATPWVTEVLLLSDPAAALARAEACQKPHCALVAALAHQRLEQPQRAKAALGRICPGDPALRCAPGWVVATASRLAVSQAPRADEAHALIARAEAAAPQSGEAQLARALHALADAHLDAAERALQAALTLRPDAPLPHLLWAQIHQARQDTPRAIDALRTGLAIAPGAHPGRARLAGLLAEIGRPAAAVAQLDRLLAARPDHVPSMLALGRTLLATGAPARALAWAERVLSLTPETPEAVLLKAEALIAHGAVAAGLALQPALYTDDAGGRMHRIRIALALSAAGHVGQAEGTLATAVREAPHDARLWAAYAAWHADAGRLSRAARLLDRGVRLHRTDPALHAALGAIRHRLEDTEGARAAYEAAVRLAPEHRVARDALALLALKAGDTAEALRRWEALLIEQPRAYQARHHLADAYRALGQNEASLGHLRTLTEQRPTDGAAWGARAEGELLIRDRDAAVRSLEAALRLGAASSRYLPLLATVLADLGRGVEAEARFRQALVTHPDNRALRLVYGHFLQREDRTHAAIEIYRTLLARDPNDTEARAGLSRLGVEAGSTQRWSAAQGHPTLQALSQRAPASTRGQGGVVLRDERYVTVDGLGVAQVRHVRSVLVQRPEGAARYQTASIAFHASHPPRVVRARTLTPEGAVVPVPAAQQTVRDPHAGTPLYGDARELNLTFARVEPGSIIDYEVITLRPHPDLTDVWWDGYILANVDPTVQVRYELRLPAESKIALRAPGLPKPTTERSDGQRTLVWTAEDLPPHSLSGAAIQSTPAVYASSLARWADVDAWYHRLFASRTVTDGAVRAQALALTTQARSRREKIGAIYQFVEREIGYLGIEFGIGAYQPRPAASTLAARRGDCKDMTALMVAMLRAVGIDAYPALVRPRNQGPFIEAHPSPGQFSHVLLYVPGSRRDGDLWLDATAGLGTLDAIPSVLRGRRALVVNGGGGRLRTLPEGSAQASQLVQSTQITLTPTGGGRLKGTITLTGDLAGVVRRTLKPLDATSQQALLTAPGYVLGDGPAPPAVTLRALDDATQPLVLQSQLAHPDLAGVRLDGGLVVSLGLGFLGDGPVPALTSGAQVRAPRSFERRLRIEPPPGYSFDWPKISYTAQHGSVSLTVREQRAVTHTELVVRLAFKARALSPEGRLNLLEALRGARTAMAVPLRMLPGPTFDRVGFLEAILQTQPSDGDLWVHLAQALLLQSKPVAAAAALASARNHGRDDAVVWALLASAWILADQPRRAIEPLEQLAVQANAPIKRHLMLAATYRVTEQPKGLVHALRRGLHLYPHDQRLAVQLVRALRDQGRLPEALEVARAHAARNPREVDAQNLRADVALASQSPQGTAEAEASLRASLALDRDQAQVLNNLAWLLRHRPEQRAEAFELIERALALAPEVDTLWDTLAELHHLDGHPVRALGALERAQRLNPKRRAFYEGRRAYFNGD